MRVLLSLVLLLSVIALASCTEADYNGASLSQDTYLVPELIMNDTEILAYTVYTQSGCSNVLFTHEFVANFSKCQTITIQGVIASFYISCYTNHTMVGISYVGSADCTGTAQEFPLAQSGHCVDLPPGAMAKSFLGYCPGDIPFNPPTTPLAPIAAGSMVAPAFFVAALAVLGAILF